MQAPLPSTGGRAPAQAPIQGQPTNRPGRQLRRELAATTRVADQIGDDPGLALRAICEALVLPYASLSASGAELATSVAVVTYTRRLPLSLGSNTMEKIVVGLRPGDLTLSAGDEHVLWIVAPRLA